jgi:hypothetical protein
MQTMANLEAVYEGRDVRIGKSWNLKAGEADTIADSSSPSARVAQLLNTAQEYLKKNVLDREGLVSRLFTPFNPVPDYVDENGFVHFKHVGVTPGGRREQPGADHDGATAMLSATSGAVKSIFNDLCIAMRKDLGLQFD